MNAVSQKFDPRDAEFVLSGIVASWYRVPILDTAALGIPYSLIRDLPGPAIRKSDLCDLARDIMAHLQLAAPDVARQAVRVRIRPLGAVPEQAAHRFEFLTYLGF